MLHVPATIAGAEGRCYAWPMLEIFPDAASLAFILLGALITRFAVLFTAGGPSAEFVDERKRDGEDAT